jgi:hypothetical protein
MKKHKLYFITIVFITAIISIFSSCASTQKITEKTGNVLWQENCLRCHNAPPSTAFNSAQWETISMHMEIRANLTDAETTKIVEYLKTGE